MRFGHSFLVAAISAALLAVPAFAASKKALRDCNQDTDLHRQVPDLDRQIAGCTRALAEGGLTSRAGVLDRRAVGWHLKGDLDRAITDLNEANRADPKDFLVYLDRGNVWVDKGEFDRAIADYDEAIRLKAKEHRAYDRRGAAWFYKGDYDRAISDFNESIRINPNFAVGYADRGESWRLKGDLARALVDQDEAIRLISKEHSVDPTHAGIYTLRGDTLRYAGYLDRALADYDQSLRLDPNNIPAFTGRGLTYERMGDFVRARTEFEKAVSSISSILQKRIYFRSGLETARARLAALDSGVAQPNIPISLLKATSATSIPTPTAVIPAVVPAAIAQGRRVALVIGNSAYQNVPALPNPKKDATSIAASLRNIGFEVISSNDATREELIDSLRNFANEAENSDWAVVYYAGHGMEIGGVNYLVPVDARLAVDRDIQYEAVPLSQILSAADTAKRIKLCLTRAATIRSRRAEPRCRKRLPRG